MWKSQLALLFNCCLYLTVQADEILLLNDDDDDINSTTEVFVNSRKDVLPVWSSGQLFICFASVIIGTFLVFITFIVPIMIIMRRAKREENRSDFSELRRMSDFM